MLLRRGSNGRQPTMPYCICGYFRNLGSILLANRLCTDCHRLQQEAAECVAMFRCFTPLRLISAILGVQFSEEQGNFNKATAKAPKSDPGKGGHSPGWPRGHSYLIAASVPGGSGRGSTSTMPCAMRSIFQPFTPTIRRQQRRGTAIGAR